MGQITVNAVSDYNCSVTLCDSSKKELTGEDYVTRSDNYKSCYAVEKGVYYIKVTTSGETGCVMYKFNPAKRSGGASKAKAVKMKKNKTVKGLFTTGDKKGASKWYKIILTKTGKIKFEIKGDVTYTSGGCEKIIFILTSNKIGGTLQRTISNIGYSSKFTAETILRDKLPKGTYYVKMVKGSKKTNGTYSVKYK